MEMRNNFKPLNIIIQCQSLSVGKGGAERVASELSAEMARRGHIVHIGYRYYGPVAYSVSKSVKFLPYDSDRDLVQKVRAVDPDVFFSFYTNHLLINNYRVVHGSKIPFAMQECTNPQRLCCNNWRSGNADHCFSTWEREVVASAAVRIRLTMPGYANSFPRFVRHQIRAYVNPAFSQTNVARPGGEPGQRKTILNINGFKANKNLITLLQAFARLSKSFPDWDLKVIGKAPNAAVPNQLALLDFIRENKLEQRVIIIGPTDNLYPHYASAHIHVIPSLSEGCPTVVLEAMSVGLPSIGYADCPGTNELIRHESNGLLAAVEDRVAGMEAALRRLMTSPELRAALGHQALEDSKAFDPKNIYDQWEQLFYEAAEYKKEPDRLFREQMAIDPEKAMHTRRMRDKIMQQVKVR